MLRGKGGPLQILIGSICPSKLIKYHYFTSIPTPLFIQTWNDDNENYFMIWSKFSFPSIIISTKCCRNFARIFFRLRDTTFFLSPLLPKSGVKMECPAGLLKLRPVNQPGNVTTNPTNIYIYKIYSYSQKHKNDNN